MQICVYKYLIKYTILVLLGNNNTPIITRALSAPIIISKYQLVNIQDIIHEEEHIFISLVFLLKTRNSNLIKKKYLVIPA